MSTLFGIISVQDFLQDYWQKKPLLFKNALPQISKLIDPNEIAGLAYESFVESRLIIQQSEQDWQLLHGPFDDDTFSQLPPTHWTLLVQAVEFYLPKLATLWQDFNFLPNWRIDDIMVSYASDGGNVGPHLDNYDVFLIQAHGKRHWRVSADQHHQEIILDCGLKHVSNAHFESMIDCIVEPGDVLYIPPKFAHHGIAKGECTTVSMGFRAPENHHLLSRVVDHLLENTPDAVAFMDPQRTLPHQQGLITEADLAQLRKLIHQQLSDPKQLNHLISKVITEPKYLEFDFEDCSSEDEYTEAQDNTDCYTRHPAVKFGYQLMEDQAIVFYLNGQDYRFPLSDLDILQKCCNQPKLPNTQLNDASPALKQAFQQWLTQGYWY